ncbi:solute carrier family 25 member 47 isoform X1 [Pseudorca crassidens]|uniref:solute carrier family 25 member 47 isoform X1 n=1 Tax=Pseudorca crassidens TaxID=82174 RepID=UPI00352D1C40
MEFAAGAIGGVCGVAVGYPLDTVKVRIQTEPKYTGIWHCIRDTYRRERVWGFYRGLSLPVCTVSLVSSVSFGTYRHCLAHVCRFRYGSADAKPAKTDITLSGFASGLVRVFLTSPTEVAKVRLQTQTHTQMQTQQRRPSASGPSAAPPTCPAPAVGRAPGPKYRGPLHCLASVAREEGLRGLYKGSSALLFRDGHSFATYFLSYAVLCEQLTPAGRSRPGERGPGPGAVLVARLSLAGVDVGGGDGLRSHWHPVPPRWDAHCPQQESGQACSGWPWTGHVGGESPGLPHGQAPPWVPTSSPRGPQCGFQPTCPWGPPRRRLGRAAGRWLCRGAGLGRGHPYGRDQVAPAGGWAGPAPLPGPPALRGDQRSGGGAEGALQGAVAQLLPRLPRQHGGLCHLRGRAEAHAGPALIAGAHPPGPTRQQLPEAAGAGGGGEECRGLGPRGPSPRLTTRRSRGPGLA